MDKEAEFKKFQIFPAQHDLLNVPVSVMLSRWSSIQDIQANPTTFLKSL